MDSGKYCLSHPPPSFSHSWHTIEGKVIGKYSFRTRKAASQEEKGLGEKAEWPLSEEGTGNQRETHVGI